MRCVAAAMLFCCVLLRMNPWGIGPIERGLKQMLPAAKRGVLLLL
jgi:hypothetical protein